MKTDWKPAPPCSCGHSGAILHRDDCKRFVAMVAFWKPPGLTVEKGKVVRS